MPEGQINGEAPGEVTAAEAVSDLPEPIDVPAGQAVHFPTPKAVLTPGGQKVLNALRPQR